MDHFIIISFTISGQSGQKSLTHVLSRLYSGNDIVLKGAVTPDYHAK